VFCESKAQWFLSEETKMNVDLSEAIVQICLLARELQAVSAEKTKKEIEAVLMAVRQNATQGLLACREGE
jgi:hypothetical protein